MRADHRQAFLDRQLVPARPNLRIVPAVEPPPLTSPQARWREFLDAVTTIGPVTIAGTVILCGVYALALALQ